MADHKRRTQIQIETHEITTIRFGKIEPLKLAEITVEDGETRVHNESDPGLLPQMEGVEEK